MSDTVNLKRTVFGVSKKNVTEYIDKVSKDIDDKLLMKDREIAEMRSKNEKLGENVKALEEKLKAMESEKEKIASAFVKAQEGAEKIIADARREADSLLAIAKEDAASQLAQLEREKEAKTAEINAQIDKQKSILDSYKNEIELLRESVNKIIPKFDEILKRYQD